MMSLNCSKLMWRSCIFFQMLYGCFSRPEMSAGMPARDSSSLVPDAILAMRSPPPSFSCASRRVIDWYASGSSCWKASVCISFMNSYIPIRSASGA